MENKKQDKKAAKQAIKDQRIQDKKDMAVMVQLARRAASKGALVYSNFEH